MSENSNVNNETSLAVSTTKPVRTKADIIATATQAKELILGVGSKLSSEYPITDFNTFFSLFSTTCHNELRKMAGYYPEFLLKWTLYSVKGNNDISSAQLILRSKLAETYTFRHEGAVGYNQDFVSNLIEFVADGVEGLVINQLAGQNLDILNERLSQICADDVNVTVSFDLGNNGLISDIDDTSVVYYMPVESAMGLSTMTLLDTSDAYSAICAKIAAERLCECLKSCQNSVQFVKSDCEFLKSIGYTSKKRIDTIIRQRFTKNAQFLRSNNAGVGYVSKDNIFGLVEKVEGEFKVKLSPIDVTTLFNVEDDIFSLFEKP